MTKNKDSSLEVVSNYLKDVKEILRDADDHEAEKFAEWTKLKADLIFNKKVNTELLLIANCLYRAELGYNIGSEQSHYRPILVIKTIRQSPVCTVIPLTLERLDDKYDFHVDLENRNSTAMIEHLRVISKKRILEPIRSNGEIESISLTDWKNINTQLTKLYKLLPLKR